MNRQHRLILCFMLTALVAKAIGQDAKTGVTVCHSLSTILRLDYEKRTWTVNAVWPLSDKKQPTLFYKKSSLEIGKVFAPW